MAFTLEVEFTGLCLYYREKDVVTVLMPDCRRNLVNDVHLDKTRGDPHVGYLRVDMTNIATGVAQGDPIDGPRYEVVYQFDKEELDFGFDGVEKMDFESLGLPSFRKILGSGAELHNNVLNGWHDALLFRTILRGGILRGRRGNGHWRVTSRNTAADEQQGQFSEVIIWKREVKDRDALILRLSKHGQATQTLRLAPTTEGGTIRLKIANLCSTNPLEWEGLKTHTVQDTDNDFQWLYRLFNTNGDTFPVPEMIGFQAFGAEDCLGGCFTPSSENC